MKLGKTLLIYNPVSGPSKGRIPVEVIKEKLSHIKSEFDTLVTQHKGHSGKFLKESPNKYETIVCSGGDGSVNEIINSLTGSEDTSILLVPQGTGNDLNRTLNPTSSKHILNNLDFTNFKKSVALDIGELTGTYSDGTSFTKQFCNAIGIGLDSLIAKYVSEIKNRNNLSYITSLLKAIIHYKPIKGAIKVNDKTISARFILLSVNNGITSGGGFYLTPDALVDDQKLDLCFINELSKFRILTNFSKVLGNRIKEFKEVELYQSEKYSIELDEPYHLHIDGEMEEKPVKELSIGLSKKRIKFHKI